MRLPLVLLMVGAASVAHGQFSLIPNGDFELADASGTWTGDGAAGTTIQYLSSGGSGDNGGYASINEPGGGWGVLVSPPTPGAAGGGIPIVDLGLTAGETYTFQMDLKNFAGTGTGGLKVEAWASNALVGNSGDMFAATQTADWATYSWDWTLPAGTEKLIMVPLWGAGSTVGYDNVGVVVPEPGTYAAFFGALALAVVLYRRRRA